MSQNITFNQINLGNSTFNQINLGKVINPLSVINSNGNITLSTNSYINFGSLDTNDGYGIRDYDG